MGLNFIWVVDQTTGQLRRFNVLDARRYDDLVSADASAITLTRDSAWLMHPGRRDLGRVSMIGTSTRRVLPLHDGPTGFIYADGIFWVVEPARVEVEHVAENGGPVLYTKVGYTPHFLAVTPGSVWVTSNQSITRIYSRHQARTVEISAPDRVIGIAADPGSSMDDPSVWVLLEGPASSPTPGLSRSSS